MTPLPLFSPFSPSQLYPYRVAMALLSLEWNSSKWISISNSLAIPQCIQCHQCFFHFIIQYECCGLSNGLDYGSPNITWNSADLNVPPTCCKIRDGSNTLIADLKNSKESTFTLENENCPSKAHDEFKTVSTWECCPYYCRLNEMLDTCAQLVCWWS